MSARPLDPIPLARARVAALPAGAWGIPIAWWLLGGLIATLEAPAALAAGATVRIVGDVAWTEQLAGRPATRGRLLTTLDALGAAVAYSLALWVGLVPLGLGTVWALAAWGPWLPVVVLEGRGLHRTATLTTGRRAEVLVTWAPAVLAVWIVPLVAGQFAEALGLGATGVQLAIVTSHAAALALQGAVGWALYRCLTDGADQG